MSSAFMEDLGLEYDDAYDDAELYDDSEAYDDSESNASRGRRRRAQALAVARRRAAARRGRRAPAALTTAAPPRAVVNAVKELDLQGQVQQDNLRSALASLSKKQQQSNLATVLAVLLGQGLDTFGTPDNTFVTAGIKTLPLGLLPGSNLPGVNGIIRHPAVYGGAGMLALAFIGNQLQSGSAVSTINVVSPSSLFEGQEDVLLADVLDSRGRILNISPSWQSDNPGVVDVNPTTGRIKAGTAGVAIISVTAGDVTRRLRLDVQEAPWTVESAEADAE